MIGQAVGEVLALGVGVALSPLAIVALVVMLVAPAGVQPAWTFFGAWVLSLCVVSTLVLLLADGADASENGAPATWANAVKIIVGLVLVVFAVREWRVRASAEREVDEPGWMRKLDTVTVPKAAGLAALFVVKPKNLLLTIGAGVAVAEVGASPTGQAVAVAVFVALGAGGLAVPLSIHVFMSHRGRGLLIALRDWMVRENATIIAILSLIIARSCSVMRSSRSRAEHRLRRCAQSTALAPLSWTAALSADPDVQRDRCAHAAFAEGCRASRAAVASRCMPSPGSPSL